MPEKDVERKDPTHRGRKTRKGNKRQKAEEPIEEEADNVNGDGIEEYGEDEIEDEDEYEDGEDEMEDGDEEDEMEDGDDDEDEEADYDGDSEISDEIVTQRTTRAPRR